MNRKRPAKRVVLGPRKAPESFTKLGLRRAVRKVAAERGRRPVARHGDDAADAEGKPGNA